MAYCWKSPTEEIKNLNNKKNIFVHNYIEDLDSFLVKIDLCIIPLLEVELRMMKINTMTERLIPCVATSLANRNSSLLENKEILVANDPKAFAGAVIKFLNE